MRLRLATWRNVAAAMKGAFTRGRCRVSGSQPRVSRSVSSTQSNVDLTASSCARITERSPRGWRSVGSNAASDTDFGAEKVRVESRTALVPAVPDPPQPDLRPRHMTLQQPLERPRRHPCARLQTQRLRPTPVPRARLAVLLPLRVKRSRVALRPDVIPPVVPEILHGGRRRGQIADRRYHRNEP